MLDNTRKAFKECYGEIDKRLTAKKIPPLQAMILATKCHHVDQALKQLEQSLIQFKVMDKNEIIPHGK